MRVLGTMSRFLFLLRSALANPSIFQFVLPYKSRAFNFLSRPRILRAGEEKMNLCVGWFINQNSFIISFDRAISTGTVYQILEYLRRRLPREKSPKTKQFEKNFAWWKFVRFALTELEASAQAIHQISSRASGSNPDPSKRKSAMFALFGTYWNNLFISDVMNTRYTAVFRQNASFLRDAYIYFFEF